MMTTFTSASLDDGSTALCWHPGSKSMHSKSATYLRLICAFRHSNFL